MNFATATQPRRHDVAMIFVKQPHVFVFGVCLLVLYGCLWYTCSGDWNSAEQPSLFASCGDVREITNGSLEVLSSSLRSNSFKFVLFYAPWCAQSKRVMLEFSTAASLLKDKVKFIAINCWTGTCKETHVLDSFPKIFAYHSGFNGVQYVGDYDARQMVRFLYKVIRPIHYIGRVEDFTKLEEGTKGFVVGYFNSTTLDSRNYSVYFSVALQNSGKATMPMFTLVTNQELAQKAGISSSSGLVHHRVRGPPVVYPEGANYTKDAIIHWIERHSEELIVQLSASVTGRDHLVRQLKRGAALILFIPLALEESSQSLMDVYTHVAKQFYNCSCNVSLHGAPSIDSGDARETETATLETIEQERRVKPHKSKNDAPHAGATASGSEKGSSLFVAAFEVQQHCRSVVLNQDNRNVCDVCNTCQNFQGCSDLTDLQIKENELRKQFPAGANTSSKSCISMQSSYNPGLTINACCIELNWKEDSRVSSGRRALETDALMFESAMKLDVADVGGVVDQWIKRFSISEAEGALWDVRAQVDGARVFITGKRGVETPATESPTKRLPGEQGNNSNDYHHHHRHPPPPPPPPSRAQSAENSKQDDEVPKEENTTSHHDVTDLPEEQQSADKRETTEDRAMASSESLENHGRDDQPNVRVSHGGNVTQHSADTPSSGPNNSCPQSGHVVEFKGAGCLSNRSLNFFYMDSSQYWSVAQRLGLAADEAKVGLVIVDLKNEAQFVLDEGLEITNASIVNFMMKFMSGNLQRRFTSSRHAASTCASPNACVVEVTAATFDEVVLEEDKDVLLLYYAPWCGYCVGLAPVYLTVARFFENVTRVRIARINADENDLSYEFMVTHYPTFILYPAGRKDFSVRFPGAEERTAPNLIQFVLDNASERTREAIYGHHDDDLCGNSKFYWTKLRELESRLQSAEAERAVLKIKLRDAIQAKNEAEQKWEEAKGNIQEVNAGNTIEERILRAATDYMNDELEKRIQQVEGTSFEAIAAGSLFFRELELLEDMLQAKKEQLEQQQQQKKSEWWQKPKGSSSRIQHTNLREQALSLLRKLRRLEVASSNGAVPRGAACGKGNAQSSHDRTCSHHNDESLSRERTLLYYGPTEDSQHYRSSQGADGPENADSSSGSIPAKQPRS